MIALPNGARVWLATGHTDMRKGWQSLALLVQETLKRDPNGGHLFVSEAVVVISSNAFGTTSRVNACFRSGWNAAASMAVAGGRRGHDQHRAIGLSSIGYRLAGAATHVAPTDGGLIAVL